MLSLYREVGGVRQYTRKIAMLSVDGCCTAATMALTSIKQKVPCHSSASASSLLVGTPLVTALLVRS